MSTDRLREDLQARCRELGIELTISAVNPIPEGHSGFTYFVETEGGGPRLVLRVPPPGARPTGPADVVRQGRIMAALNEAGVPAPRVLAMSGEPVVDGRPFVLMEAVSGDRIETARSALDPIQIAEAAIRALKRMQAVPVERSGIGSEEPASLEAELTRWAWLMERAPAELTGRAGELGGILGGSRPPARPPVLVHGDFHYGNLLFEGGRVSAILDWEIAEIGQPLIDLGCMCVMAKRDSFQGDYNPGGGVSVPVDEVVRLYGVDASEMLWYVAFSCYKYAAILGYNLMLHRRGKRPDPYYEHLTGTISGLIDEGIATLARKEA